MWSVTPKQKCLGVCDAAAAGGGGGVVTCDHSGLHIFLIFEPIFGTVTLLKSSDDGRDRDWGSVPPSLPAVLLLLLLQRHRVS